MKLLFTNFFLTTIVLIILLLHFKSCSYSNPFHFFQLNFFHDFLYFIILCKIIVHRPFPYHDLFLVLFPVQDLKGANKELFILPLEALIFILFIAYSVSRLTSTKPFLFFLIFYYLFFDPYFHDHEMSIY